MLCPRSACIRLVSSSASMPSSSSPRVVVLSCSLFLSRWLALACFYVMPVLYDLYFTSVLQEPKPDVGFFLYEGELGGRQLHLDQRGTYR